MIIDAINGVWSKISQETSQNCKKGFYWHKFLWWWRWEKKLPIYVSKNFVKIKCWFIIERERREKFWATSWRKHFCRYCLQAFRKVEKLKCRFTGCLVNKDTRCKRNLNNLNSKILKETFSNNLRFMRIWKYIGSRK